MKHIIEWTLLLFGTTLLRYFIIAGTAFILFYYWFAEKLRDNKIQRKLAKKADFFREIRHSLSSSFIMVLVALPFSLPPLKVYTSQYKSLDVHGILYLLVSVILALIVHDTYFYWMHRLLHHPSLFRRTHLIHHMSTNPSPWTSYAFHYFEAFAEALILPIVLFIVPMHPVAIALFILASFTINVYGHLGYEIMPRWFRHSLLFQILNTSVHHNLHHSKFSGNYGLYFRVWDRLMGTEHPAYVSTYDKIQNQRFSKEVFSIREK